MKQYTITALTCPTHSFHGPLARPRHVFLITLLYLLLVYCFDSSLSTVLVLARDSLVTLSNERYLLYLSSLRYHSPLALENIKSRCALLR